MINVIARCKDIEAFDFVVAQVDFIEEIPGRKMTSQAEHLQ